MTASPSVTSPAPEPPRRRRFVPVVWLSGAVAAALLVLGVTGTLSSWTAAILNNNTNSVATSNAVVLQEQITGSSTVNADCVSSNGGGSTNTSTCTEINKYGGVASPLVPGGSQTTSVTFTNVGSGSASSFSLTPGSCSQLPAAGSGSPANPASLCATTATDLTLNLSCNTGASTSGGTAIPSLAYSGALGNFSGAKTYSGTIAPQGSVTCTFVVTLISAASPLDGGITVSQPLTWELDA